MAGVNGDLGLAIGYGLVLDEQCSKVDEDELLPPSPLEVVDTVFSIPAA